MFAKTLAKIMLPASIAGTSVYNQKQYQMFEYPPTKNIIRGEYENKIRRHSAPEKIFELFATLKDDNDVMFMSHYDLFKAMSPFNYTTKEIDEDSIGGFKSSTILNFADVDQDGQISFYEYFLVICLIQSSRDDIKRWFRSQDMKEEQLTPELLQGFYQYLLKNSKAKVTYTKMPDPRKITLKKSEYDEILNQLITNIFQKQKGGKLSLKEFVQMREDLLKDIYKYEFDTFPQTNGKISGEDFAKSLVSFLDVNIVKKYLKSLESQELKGEISFTDYYVFQKFLQDNMEDLNRTIEEKGVITKNRLRKLIEHYHQKLKLKSNPDQIDILIKVLDIDRSGKIEPEEFKGIIQTRAFYGSGDDNALSMPFLGIKDLFFKWINKAERIGNIIME